MEVARQVFYSDGVEGFPQYPLVVGEGTKFPGPLTERNQAEFLSLRQVVDPFRDAVFVADSARGDEEFELEVESYIMWHFGEGTVKTVEALHWATFDEEMNAAYWDIRAAFNVLICEDIPSDLTAYLREVLHDATNGIEQECKDPTRVRAMALEARRIVRERIYECDRFRKDGLLHLCGNSHLDLVYLWTHAEYDRKLGHRLVCGAARLTSPLL